MSQQGLRQASFQAIHGGTGREYNGDAMLAMRTELEAASLAVPADYNGRMIAWLQFRLSSSDDNLPGLMAAFAAAYGADNWSSLGSFAPVGGNIAFQTFSVGKDTADTGSVTVAKPLGTLEGDKLLACSVCTDTRDLATPSGWTLVQLSSHTSNLGEFATYRKRAGASEPDSYTFQAATPDTRMVAMVFRLSGGDDTDLFVDVVANGALDQVTDSPVCPDATVVAAETIVFRLFGMQGGQLDGGVEDVGYPSGTTGIAVRSTEPVSGNSTNAAIGAAREVGSPGAIGTATFTSPAAAFRWEAQTVAIK